MSVDPVRAIADAVLYEGYMLWPYRPSAMKNQRRWTFGGVHPRAHSERHPDDRWRMRTEVLLEGAPEVEVTVRFLHIVRRRVGRSTAAGGLVWVDQFVAGGERHVAWDEAVEREVNAPAPIAIPAGSAREDLAGGAIVRSWEGLEGAVDVDVATLAPDLHRVTVGIANTTSWPGGDREEALRRTLCSTHTVLRAVTGAFVSLTDPPERLREAAAACRNEGTWPVLVGEPGERDTVLSSPIILEDHPRIAPESPGDLFDGGEIDQMLVLNILSLTDEERADMRDADPRTREILERTEALTEEELMRLHGAIREFGMARER
jgi:hypothetical protein